jgi:hypothetical protein
VTTQANSHIVGCPKCDALLVPDAINAFEAGSCQACGVPLSLTVFPALLRAARKGKQAETLLVEGEAGCFYHASKKAVLTCDMCGRFLCSLCSIDLGGQNLCTACIQAGKRKGALDNLTRHRLLYDEVALALSLLPLLLWPITVLTAPATFVVIARHWNGPASLVPRSRVRFILAGFFAALQITGWTALIVALLTG